MNCRKNGLFYLSDKVKQTIRKMLEKLKEKSDGINDNEKDMPQWQKELNDLLENEADVKWDSDEDDDHDDTIVSPTE